jgi:hypothetical protein
MSTPFSAAEIGYILAWAKEDHQGRANGPARRLQRQHGIHAATLGQLFARLSTVIGRNQYALEESAPQVPIIWPWATPAIFEVRLKELLPESTIHYLEQLGALAGPAVPS